MRGYARAEDEISKELFLGVSPSCLYLCKHHVQAKEIIERPNREPCNFKLRQIPFTCNLTLYRVKCIFLFSFLQHLVTAL